MVAFRKINSFKYKLGILLFSTVLIASGILGVFQYFYVSRILEGEYEKSRQLVRDRVLNIVNDADYMNVLVEKPLEAEAEQVLEQVVKEYNSRGTIEFDLHPYIADKDGVNLYIINSENIVVAATDGKDIGLDFSPWPDFVQYLQSIRYTRVFTPARMSLSLRGAVMTKYCYMATADGKYIFETGTPIEPNEDMLKNIGFDKFEERVVEENHFVDDVILFDYEGISYKKTPSGDNIRMHLEYMPYFNEAIETMKTVETVGEYKGRKAYYQFVPYQIIGAQGANERNVVQIIYNDIELQKKLRNNQLIIGGIILLGALVSGSFGLYKSRGITKPIEEITASIDQVSEGNFDVRLDIQTNYEFEKLSRQFENMAREIQNLLNERYENERKLEEKNEEIYAQKTEITALYEETEAMNEELTVLLQDNRKSYFETVRALANAIEAKDSYTGGHCERVTEYSLLIAKAMKLSEASINDLKFGSILHDIGKIGIPESILNMEGSYSEQEYKLMKKHPEIGNIILKELHFLDGCRRIVYEHHERIDGKGYPNSLKGDQISLLSKIVCVADAYDAMTSIRPYRKKVMTVDEAVNELLANRGTQFDEQVVDVFIELLRKRTGDGLSPC
jgi:HD-GYP domain-containing protein (c-di-GMP phosphodiesterase class II)